MKKVPYLKVIKWQSWEYVIPTSVVVTGIALKAPDDSTKMRLSEMKASIVVCQLCIV